MTADTVTTGLDTATTGYTVSLWIYPREVRLLHRCRLLSDEHAKRFTRRSLLTHEDIINVTTVLAFEGPSGGDDALILYDGQQFMYYDDTILVASAVFQAVSSVNEWHLVTLSWAANGEGYLYVDGEGYLYVDNNPAQSFTTNSHPQPDSHLSLCQDYNLHAGPAG